MFLCLTRWGVYDLHTVQIFHNFWFFCVDYRRLFYYYILIQSEVVVVVGDVVVEWLIQKTERKKNKNKNKEIVN